MPTPRFVICIPSYNNEKWAERNILSALSQWAHYDNFRIIFRDDASTDTTLKIVQDLVEKHPLKNLVSVQSSQVRGGIMSNHYAMFLQCQLEEIIVCLDGDDQFSFPGVLRRLAQIYLDGSTWLTYGSFEYDHESRNPDPAADPRGFVSQIPPHKHDRRANWYSSHLKTFYSWLFNKIDPEDMKLDGEWLGINSDCAMMYPMIEMAGAAHAKYVPEILYLYNGVNPLTDKAAWNKDRSDAALSYIHGQLRYAQLSHPQDSPRRLL